MCQKAFPPISFKVSEKTACGEKQTPLGIEGVCYMRLNSHYFIAVHFLAHVFIILDGLGNRPQTGCALRPLAVQSPVRALEAVGLGFNTWERRLSGKNEKTIQGHTKAKATARARAERQQQNHPPPPSTTTSERRQQKNFECK